MSIYSNGIDVRTKVRLIRHLRKLGNREIKPIRNSVGLCYELDNKFNVGYNLITKHSISWSKYSGSTGFPIPHTKLKPLTAWLRAGNMWDARTTYGKNRLELCLHIANELEKELAADE